MRDTDHETADGSTGTEAPNITYDRVPGNPDATDSSGETLGSIDRRDYLRAVGVAGTLGALGTLAGPATGGAAAQQTGNVAIEQDDQWEADADARIEEHRTGDLEVVVQDDSGNPVSGAQVDVEMTEHDYHFGSMIHAEFLTEGTEWGDPIEEDGTTFDETDQQRYAETADELFNTVVLENLHKWLLWEENKDIADAAVDWALERGKDVRGHVCIWGNVDAWAIPPDVVEAMGVSPNETNFDHDDFTEANHDPDYVIQESLAHIEEIISHYGDDIYEWEVANEVVNVPDMIEAVEGQGVDAVTAPILGDWYERAEEVASQYGVGICVNDYNTLVGPYDGTRQDYRRQIDYLVNERGIDLDGIGFQCHFSDHETLYPDQVLDALEYYGGFGATFRSTEFDMYDGNWGGSAEYQGQYLYQFLKTWFSAPETEAFLVWGHWDGVHWGPETGGPRDAPFYDDDWNEKPALDYYRDLVFDQWWTEESGTTDDSGTFSTSAFYGDYEITVTAGGETVTETVSFTADGSNQVTIVAGEGEPPAPNCEEEGGIQVGDNCAMDENGDGYYRDVDGSGDTGSNDVVEFFRNFESSSVQENPSAFDYNDSGSVGFDDVVALFNEV